MAQKEIDAKVFERLQKSSFSLYASLSFGQDLSRLTQNQIRIRAAWHRMHVHSSRWRSMMASSCSCYSFLENYLSHDLSTCQVLSMKARYMAIWCKIEGKPYFTVAFRVWHGIPFLWSKIPLYGWQYKWMVEKSNELNWVPTNIYR